MFLKLRQSYPNPFTNFTTIEYDVPSDQNVVIRIFNIRGQIVKTLVTKIKMLATTQLFGMVQMITVMKLVQVYISVKCTHQKILMAVSLSKPKKW